MNSAITLQPATRADIKQMQRTVVEHHYLHRPIDERCSIEAYSVVLGAETEHWSCKNQIGLLMFGRPEATRCGSWYGSVDDVAAGRCEVTRWQVLNLARVWFSPDVQPGGYLYNPTLLPGYTDRHKHFRSTLASHAIGLAAQQIGFDYLIRRPPCFLEEPYEIKYLMSYCDRRVHRGIIYSKSGFNLWRTNSNQIETWRLRLPALTTVQRKAVEDASLQSKRSQKYRSERTMLRAQMQLLEVER